MIQKLKHNDNLQYSEKDIIRRYCDEKIIGDKSKCVNFIYDIVKTQKINEFYALVGECLMVIGFEKVSVTRDGDTNNRMDALIISDNKSIPIEIKSPTEVEYVNVKSVRQALENKIVLLSRKFYPTTNDTTSLAIAYDKPNDRSVVDTLIKYFKKTYNINIGYIDFKTLIKICYDIIVNKKTIDKNIIIELQGGLTYD